MDARSSAIKTVFGTAIRLMLYLLCFNTGDCVVSRDEKGISDTTQDHFGCLLRHSCLQTFNCSQNAHGIVLTILPSPESQRIFFPSLIKSSSDNVRTDFPYSSKLNEPIARGIATPGD